MSVARIEARSAWVLVSPALLCMALFLIGPSLVTLGLSLTDWQFGAPGFSWVGFGNFVEMWHDQNFWKGFSNTLKYLLLVVPTAVVLGLLLAVLIEADEGLRSLYRAALFLPVASTLIAMAIVWQFMLHPSAGIVNRLLEMAGGESRNWLEDPETVLWALGAIGIWEKTGVAMVLFMAGLKSVPRDLYDAGAIDGIEGPLGRMLRITLPMLGPTTFFVLTYSAIRAFQVFDTVQVLTQGGPYKASEVMLHLIYSEGFGFFRAGYASALVVVFLLMVLLLTLAQVLVGQRRVHY